MSRQSLGSFRLPTILCAFHPNQTIQHFCRSKQCMLPLCKVCISIHQKQHKSMTSPPIIMEIDTLMQGINKQVQHQKQDVFKKHSSIKRFYRLSSDLHQDTMKKLQQNRDKAIQDINAKYNSIMAEMSSLYQQKIVELRTIDVKLEVLESTLDLVKGTFSKSKPMRTVILWESNGLSELGGELLFQIDQKIKNDQNHQLWTNKYYLDSFNILKPQMKKQTQQSEIKTLNKYLNVLGSIIQMEIDTRNSNDIKKSFMKLRTSGISLTEVSIIKSETKKSKDSQILSTPDRVDYGIRLKDLGRQIKSGRTLTKQ